MLVGFWCDECFGIKKGEEGEKCREEKRGKNKTNRVSTIFVCCERRQQQQKERQAKKRGKTKKTKIMLGLKSLEDAQHYIWSHPASSSQCKSLYEYELRMALFENGAKTGVFGRKQIEKPKPERWKLNYQLDSSFEWYRDETFVEFTNVCAAANGSLLVIWGPDNSLAVRKSDGSVASFSGLKNVSVVAVHSGTNETAVTRRTKGRQWNVETYDNLSGAAPKYTSCFFGAGPCSLDYSKTSNTLLIAAHIGHIISMDTRLSGDKPTFVILGFTGSCSKISVSPNGYNVACHSRFLQKVTIYDIRVPCRPKKVIDNVSAMCWRNRSVCTSTLSVCCNKTELVDYCVANDSLRTVSSNRLVGVREFFWHSGDSLGVAFTRKNVWGFFSDSTKETDLFVSRANPVAATIDQSCDRVYWLSEHSYASAFDFGMDLQRQKTKGRAENKKALKIR